MLRVSYTVGEAGGVGGEGSIVRDMIEGRDVGDVNGLESHFL